MAVVQYAVTLLVTAPEKEGHPKDMDVEELLDWASRNECEVKDVEES